MISAARIRTGLRPVLPLAGFLIGMVIAAGQARAQQEILIAFVEEQAFDLSPPTFAERAVLVSIDSSLLLRAEPGLIFQIQIDENDFATLEVEEVSSYLNGDRMLSAHGASATTNFSLVLTIGQQNLFGHLIANELNLQVYAVGDAVSGAGAYIGWIYSPGQLAGGPGGLQNDYIIIEQETGTTVEKPAPLIKSTLPLQLAAGSSSSSTDTSNVSTAGIDPDNFRITQTFSRNPVIAGNNVEVRVSLENISTQQHQQLYVEFYFVLENSSLLQAPVQCTQQLSLSLQQVLYCDIGDFAAGEIKNFSFELATSAASKPMIISTPIIGNLRLDSIINVVDDVRVDSDSDGISDFNEALAGTDSGDPASVDLSNTVIDVMAFYTVGAQALFPYGVETRINQLISVANQIYADSDVKISLRPVFHGLLDYNDVDDMDTALNHLINKTDPAFADVDTLRASYGADLVMLFRPQETAASRCGLAPVGGFNTAGDFSAETERDYAYSHIAIDCPADIAVVHELGHNMGLTHSHFEDGSGGTFNFSTGYGVDSQFVTVMAYPAAFNTDNRLAQFSNPRLDCLGFVCGVDANAEFGADAALSLNLVRHQIANYTAVTVPDLPTTAVATFSGESTTATIAIAASRDDGLSYSEIITTSDEVDIVANIEVDDRHVGSDGSFHVLVALRNSDLYQIDETGALTVWDGSLSSLYAASGTHQLREQELFSIVNGYRFDEALVGQDLLIYVAYKLPGVGDLVYTANPLVLQIR